MGLSYIKGLLTIVFIELIIISISLFGFEPHHRKNLSKLPYCKVVTPTLIPKI